MGLLGDSLKKAVRNAVSAEAQKKISESMQKVADKAVSSLSDAIEKATDDKDDNEKTAEEKQEKSLQEQRDAASAKLADTLGGLAAALGTIANPQARQSLSELSKTAQNFVSDFAKTMKECPACGELCSADQKFCPKCGAELPEVTIGEFFKCPACGEENAIGTKYCVKCGAELPVRTLELQKFESDWKEKLGDYPMWTFGGNDLSIDDNGTDADGNYYYYADIRGITRDNIKQYQELLKENGFKAPIDHDDTLLYKVVNGVCRVFSSEMAFENGPEIATLSFWVEDYEKKDAEKLAKANEPEKSGKEELAEAAEAAKKVLGSLFKK